MGVGHRSMGRWILYLDDDVQKGQGNIGTVLGMPTLWSHIRRQTYRVQSVESLAAVEMVVT